MTSAESDATVAATFADGGTITEGQITSFIDSYRKQQGFEGSSDEAWATFLAQGGTDPQALRADVVDQLVIDEMVQRRADETGAKVDEQELADYIQTFKGNLAFGDDEIYRQTLEMQGQTVEQAEEGFRKLFLEQALFEVEVPKPDVTDDQVIIGVANAYPEGVEAKHVYRFSKNGFDEGDSYKKFAAVQDVRDRFASGELNADRFAELIESESDNEALRSSLGDDGWSITAYEHNDEYQVAVEALEEGEISPVFVDDEGYSFVWVDQVYSIPPTSDGGLANTDLSTLPKSLLKELRSEIADQYWQYECQNYLNKLLEDANVTLNPMPANVPYNVDMSLADVQLEEVDASDASDSSATASSAS